MPALLIGAGSTKPTPVASLLRMSLGLGGKPPRPAITNSLSLPRLQGFWAMRVAGSITFSATAFASSSGVGTGEYTTVFSSQSNTVLNL